ncbi:MAG: Hemolysin, chromosomal, partial [Planctomycetota bacterium]
MTLQSWLKEFPQRVLRRKNLRGRRRFQHISIPRSAACRHFAPAVESFEDRVLPASFTWVGDVNSLWSHNVASDTNWSDDGLPADGDSLFFGESVRATIDNDLTADSSYTMTFTTGGYTVTGHGIALRNAGTDVIQIAGENLLQTPLEFSASELDVQSGVLIIDSNATGTGGLTKSGSGTLVISGPAEWSGITAVSAGTLQLDSVLQSSDPLTVASAAVLTGHGGTTAALDVSGTLAPTPDSDGFTAAAAEFHDTATLEITIAGREPGNFTKLVITDSAILDGTLAVTFANDFQPSPGDTFEILAAGSVTGTIKNWSGLDYGSGSLLPVQTPTGLLLIASPYATDTVSLKLDDAADATALASFFAADADPTQSVSFTGVLCTLQQQLTGSFTFSRTLLADGTTTVVSIQAANATLAIHGETAQLISIADGSGSFLMTNNGLWGQLAVSLSETLLDLQLSGSFSLLINTSDNPAPGILELPAGPFLRFSATDAALNTAAGLITGPLTIEASLEADGPALRFAEQGLRVFYGSDAGTATLSDDWGAVIESATLAGIVAADGTVALAASGDVALLQTGDLQLSGVAVATLNTTGSDW